MSKFVLSLLLVVVAFPAFAGCEDGEAMAEDAAVKAASKSAVRCKSTEVSEPESTPSGEAILVSVRCSERNYTYRVTLREVEDAVCYVQKVELATAGSKIVQRAPKCPRPGTTVNCMPITTNPYCVPQTRQWIQTHCPRVSFLD